MQRTAKEYLKELIEEVVKGNPELREAGDIVGCLRQRKSSRVL